MFNKIFYLHLSCFFTHWRLKKKPRKSKVIKDRHQTVSRLPSRNLCIIAFKPNMINRTLTTYQAHISLLFQVYFNFQFITVKLALIISFATYLKRDLFPMFLQLLYPFHEVQRFLSDSVHPVLYNLQFTLSNQRDLVSERTIRS